MGLPLELLLGLVPQTSVTLDLSPFSNEPSKPETVEEIISFDIDKLTPFMLNKLIERIEIEHVEIIDGQSQQEITIIWRFAGAIA
jgi:hypothetical protein